MSRRDRADVDDSIARPSRALKKERAYGLSDNRQIPVESGVVLDARRPTPLDRARLLSVTANDEVAFWSGRDGPVV